MTKGGVMIGSTVSRRSPFLNGTPRARRDQREGEAQQRGAGRGAEREEEGPPGDAAAAVPVRQREAPDLRVADVLGHALGGEGAAEVLEGAGEHRHERVEDEGRDQQHQQRDRAQHEGVALQRPALGQAEGDRGRRSRAPAPMAPAPKAGCPATSPKVASSRLQFQPRRPTDSPSTSIQASPAAPSSASAPPAPRRRHGPARSASASEQQQPAPARATSGPGTAGARPGQSVGIGGPVADPVQAEEAAADAVPGQQQRRRRARRGAGGPAGGCRCVIAQAPRAGAGRGGAAPLRVRFTRSATPPTSSSQRASSALRRSELPYSAKS